MKRVAWVVLLLLLASCGETSSKKPQATASPSPSPSATYARAKAPIQPTSWIATDLDDADAFASEDSILLANDVSIMSIDPVKKRVRWRTDVPGYGVAVGFGSVWASDGEGGVIRRLDPKTGEVTKTLSFDGYPIGLALGPDGVWVAGHHDGSVARLDPKSNKVAARTTVGPVGDSGPHQLTIDGEHLYVDMINANTVVEVDIGNGKVLRTFDMPKSFSACGPMRVDDEVLWVTACMEKERVARIDLASGAIKVSDDLGSWAGGFLVRGDTLWLSTKTVPPDFTSSGGVIVGVDRSDGHKVVNLHTDTTGYGSVEAFGSWWLPTKGGLAQYRPSDLDRRR